MANETLKAEEGYVQARKRIELCLAQGEEGRTLNLRGLSLAALPPEIGRLSFLTVLDLDDNRLATLPAELGRLAGLTTLHLSTNQLTRLPPEIGQLAALKMLRVDNNQLTTLPPDIGQLSALTTLSLNHNKLTTLPPEIGRLTHLAALMLNHNSLTTLPPEIGQLTALTVVLCTRNRLTSLPPEIGQLAALKSLRIDGNQLTTLPPEIGQLAALTALDLDDNRLTALPPEIGRLAALTALHLYGNQLTTLPSEIGQLTELTTLRLDNNQLTSLPTEIGQLESLTTLSLTRNQLTELPSEIGQLTELRTLSLNQNHLETLPAELGQLSALTELYLHDNPDLGLPVEVLGPSRKEVNEKNNKPKSPSEILASYFRIVGGAGEMLGECKVIVVGRGQVGKTSLIKRLNGQSYDPLEPETHGITIQKLEFAGERGHVTGRVWDFGGQVVLHSMHEFFLTARSLYLLVLGERDDMLERDATYWLQLIRSYAGDAPVVVALNKSGGRMRQFDRETLERNYGPILAWVPTECSDPDAVAGGITALRQRLTAVLDSPFMESVRRKFPKKWRAIKAELEGMQESYLDYDNYVDRCRDLGETDPHEQAALAADLHDLGVALNYSRDPRLRDTTVLRPDWLANGIYAVLRANDLDEKLPAELNVLLAADGVITAEKLALIHKKAECWNMLRAEDYPEPKREFLLQLMDLFHLSYPMDDENWEYLVPTLLPLHQPSGAEEPEEDNRVRLRYEFEVVPAPLVPWFIARTFSLIPDRLHWRRGAILSFGDARAKVWATQDDRYVFVTVTGSDHAQKRLLAMIRGTLKKIFNEYKALSPVEQWEYKGKWVPRETLEEFGALPREGEGAEEDEPSEEVES
jgi:internalin A